MAGRVTKEARLDSREARKKLEQRGKPHYRALADGLHIGYRRNAKGGVWVSRRYVGGKTYAVETIGAADDEREADGRHVLSFWQACDLARERIGIKPAEKPYTVADAAADYLRAAQARGMKGLRTTVYTVEEHILPALGSTVLADLTTRQINAFRDKLATTPPRAHTGAGKEQNYLKVDMDDPEVQRRRRVTANRVLINLRAICNHAFREDRVDSDKAWRKVSAYKAVDAARPGHVTAAEVTRIANAARADFKPMILAAFFTGCRYGEICRLKVRDYNADAGLLSIHISKSGKARHIALTDEAVEFFRANTVGKAGDQFMFRRGDGAAWGPSNQSELMSKACRIAGVKPLLPFHGLRHSWASLSVVAGMPLMIVAKALGHRDTRMVEHFYAHLQPSYVADQIRQYAPRLGAVEPSNVTAIRR